MRGLAAVAVAAIVLIGAVLYLRRGGPDEATDASAPIARQPGPAKKPAERSARVEERLSELRDDFEHRQAAPGNLAPAKREVPTMTNRRPQPAEDAYEDEEEDPQEMEELKVTLLSDPDPDERIGAVLMLTGEEGPESLRMLLEAMDDPDPEVRLAVVEALGDRADEISPATLHPALRDPDAEVRFEAVSILGDMDNPEALAMVRSARNDEDEDVRALAEGIEDFAEEDDEDDEMNGNPVPHPTAAPHAQAQR